MEKDIKSLDEARNKAIDSIFGESTETVKNVYKTVNNKDVGPALQNEIFYVLEKYGYTREQVTPVVANLMQNLTRVKTTEGYGFKHI